MAATLLAAVIILNAARGVELSSPEVDFAVQMYDEDEETNEEEYVEEYNEPVEVPACVTNLIKGSEWTADTICTVNGKTYMYATENELRSYAIYTGNTLIADDPSLTYFERDDPNTIEVMAGERTLIVDFKNPSSVEQLKTLSSPVLSGWERCRWDRTAEFCERVQNSLEIDYPTTSITNSDHVCKWIATVALGQKTGPIKLPLLVSTYLNFEWKNRSGYHSKLNDRNAVADYIVKSYFDDVEEEFGRKNEDIPAALYSILSLRVRYFNSRYVTFQMFTNDYNGGMHGYYTDQLLSYDYVHHEEIGWKYLFKPRTEGSVLRQLEVIAETDEHYQKCQADIWDFIRQVDDDGNPTGKMLLPMPSLTPDGVVFSFQPYEISCFAAGCFHFTIPYNRLKPYLTDRAKWCIGLK